MKKAKSGLPQKAKAKTIGATAKKPCEEAKQFDGLMRLMLPDTGKSVQFEIAAQQGSAVYVAGTFNNWNPTTHPLNDDQGEGVFKATLHLPAGTHEYKFIVNGGWSCEGTCSQDVQDAHNTSNSVLLI